MTDNRFTYDTTSLSTAKPLLQSGFYSGVITDPTTRGKDKNYFTIRPKKVWDTKARKMVETGTFEPSGMLMYSVTLTSKKAIDDLQEDAPRVFGGMIFLNFDAHFRLTDNVQLGQLLHNLGIQDEDFNSAVDWEYDEDIEVPETFAEVHDVVGMLNALAYAEALMTVICQTINGMDVKVKIIKQASRDNKDLQENTIDTGTFSAPFCGVLGYSEGDEEDL